MLERIKKYFTSLSKIAILEQVCYEGFVEYNYVVVTLKQNELSVVFKEKFNSLEQLSSKVQKNIPIVLQVNGLGVLTKTNPTNLEMFENGEFYLTQNEIENNEYVSIVRKSEISDVIEFVKELKIIVVDIVVGAFNIKFYEDAFDLISSTNPHDFETKNDLIDYSFDSEKRNNFSNITIGNTLIGSDKLSSVTSGLNYLINSQFQSNEEFETERRESVFAKLNPVVALSILGFLILGFSASALYSNYLSKKYNISENKMALIQQKEKRLNSLKKEIANKNRIFELYGMNSNHQYSEYLDVLASLIPKGISLNSLSFNPLTKELKNNKNIEILKNKILVSGDVQNVDVLNDYIVEIEKHELYKKAKIVIFKKLKSNAIFELEIEV